MGKRRCGDFVYKRIVGIVLVSLGIGMFLVLILPKWCFLFAVLLVALGGWLLFSS